MLDSSQIIGITQFQRNIKKNIDTVLNGENHLILTRDTKPEAVISSYREFQRLKNAEEQLKKEQFRKLVESIGVRNKSIKEKELENDLELVEKQLKKKRHAKSRN